MYPYLFQNSLISVLLILVFTTNEAQMCKVTRQFQFSVKKFNAAEFDMTQKLEFTNSAGVTSALVLELNKMRKITLKTSTLIFDNVYIDYFYVLCPSKNPKRDIYKIKD